VNPEKSNTIVQLVTYPSCTSGPTYGATATVPYGYSIVCGGVVYSGYLLRMDVTNGSGHFCTNQNTGLISYPCPTGSLTVSPAPTDQNPPPGTVPGSYTLNSQGNAEDQFMQQTAGTYNFVASYAGDNSYTASTSPTVPVTVTPAPTTTTLTVLAGSSVGGNITFSVTLNTQSYGVAPTGTVQLLNNGAPLGSPYELPGTPYSPSTGAYATGSIIFSASLPPGTDNITVQYSGDTNYAGSTSAVVTINVTDYSLSLNPSSINISAPGQSGTSTITLTPLGGFTGTVFLNCSTTNESISCAISPGSFNLSGSTAVTATLTISTTGPANAVLPAPPRRVPPSFRLLIGWPWLLAGLLALATLVSLATARWRPAGALFATALLVVGIWVACGGGGSSLPPPSAPIASLSQTSLTFGQQGTGSTSAAQSVMLSNTGNASLSISSIALSGTNSGDFAQTNNCGTSVGAGANCTINVTFTPSATGSRSASLTITDNATGSPQTLSLTGTGVSAPAVSLSPQSLNFGQENMGLTTAPQTVTLSNTGNASLSISSIALGGAEPFDFAQSNTCGTSVAAGANCTISVTFTPGATGTLSASLSIADNASGTPQTVSLSGTGAPPITPPGTYYCFVSAASGNDYHSTTLTINVQ